MGIQQYISDTKGKEPENRNGETEKGRNGDPAPPFSDSPVPRFSVSFPKIPRFSFQDSPFPRSHYCLSTTVSAMSRGNRFDRDLLYRLPGTAGGILRIILLSLFLYCMLPQA